MKDYEQYNILNKDKEVNENLNLIYNEYYYFNFDVSSWLGQKQIIKIYHQILYLKNRLVIVYL